MANIDQNKMFDNTTVYIRNTTKNSSGMPEYKYTMPLHLGVMFPPNYSVPIYGYCAPVPVILTVMTNTLVISVLLKKHMRSPTNFLLAAMAMSDMLTGLLPLPIFVYFFSMGHYQDCVPYSWCFAFKLLYENLPVIFHTSSIWLTVGLSVQRYICICHPLHAKSWCTISNTIRGMVTVYGIAVVCHITQFFEFHITTVRVSSIVNQNVSFDGCIVYRSEWVKDHTNVYYNIYYWSRIIFVHLVPCSLLVVLNGLMIAAMHRAQLRRIKLLKQNKHLEARKLKESNNITLMLVVVAGLFLIVEIPLGIIMSLYVIENTFDLRLFSYEVYLLTTLVGNLFMMISYPLNVFIYCAMSRKFRETFKGLFKTGFPK